MDEFLFWTILILTILGALSIGGIIALGSSLFRVTDQIIASVKLESSLIHRRIDDLRGELQIMGDAFTKWLEHQKNHKENGRAFRTPETKPKVFDYESSQRATLEEFKEQ